MAGDFDCPVIALAQLNRNLENRPNKRPVNADLKESGDLSKTQTSSCLFTAMKSTTRTLKKQVQQKLSLVRLVMAQLAQFDWLLTCHAQLSLT